MVASQEIMMTKPRDDGASQYLHLFPMVGYEIIKGDCMCYSVVVDDGGHNFKNFEVY